MYAYAIACMCTAANGGQIEQTSVYFSSKYIVPCLFVLVGVHLSYDDTLLHAITNVFKPVIIYRKGLSIKLFFNVR